MLFTVPDYYKEFKCIADKCEETCCAGWKIVIDKESLKKYRGIKGDFKKRMRSSVNWFDKTFKQDKEKRCAFLNENNLCDLLLAQGEDSLCKTCTNYPRHIEEFEGVREISLSVSCPEVARILMSRKSAVTFVNYEEDGEEEYDDFDPFLFSVLEDVRAVFIKLLQNRSITIEERVYLCFRLAMSIQERIDNQQIFSCNELIEEYDNDKYIEKLLSEFDNKRADGLEKDMVFENFKYLYSLEMLKPEWEMYLNKAVFALFENGQNSYASIRDEFNALSTEDISVHFEQLLVYFIFTYVSGATYDGELLPKVWLSVYCVWMIKELWMCAWVENGKELDLAEMTEIVYRFSREIEHSDKNLELLESYFSS